MKFIVERFYCATVWLTNFVIQLLLQQSNHHEKNRYRRPVEVFVEAAVWQALASVIIPGFTINRICRLSSISLSRIAPSVSLMTRNKLTTVIGLASIPLIIKPIDRYSVCSIFHCDFLFAPPLLSSGIFVL